MIRHASRGEIRSCPLTSVINLTGYPSGVVYAGAQAASEGDGGASNPALAIQIQEPYRNGPMRSACFSTGPAELQETLPGPLHDLMTVGAFESPEGENQSLKVLIVT